MKELMMFYNVENFFPVNLEQPHLYNWTDYKYKLKLKKINTVFSLINENFSQLPSLIGLAEIGDLSVLEDLQNQDSLIKDYQIIYQKSSDKRGLSCALLYNPDYYQHSETDFIKYNFDDSQPFETRDIIHSQLIFKNQRLNIFVVHLPSQRLQDAKKIQRDYILQQLKIKIEELTKNNEAVILMGDFNENPDTKSIQNLMFDDQQNKILENPSLELFQNFEFTNYHGKTGVCFDQFLYSKNLINTKLCFKKISAKVFSPPQLRKKDSKNQKYPLRTYSGSRYIGGFSDHFPILLQLEK